MSERLTLEDVTFRHTPSEVGFTLTRCRCDFEWRRHEDHAAHQADAVRAWLLGRREVAGHAAVQAICDRDPATCDHVASARSADGIWCAWCDGLASADAVLAALTTQAREGETKEASDG